MGYSLEGGVENTSVLIMHRILIPRGGREQNTASAAGHPKDLERMNGGSLQIARYFREGLEHSWN